MTSSLLNISWASMHPKHAEIFKEVTFVVALVCILCTMLQLGIQWQIDVFGTLWWMRLNTIKLFLILIDTSRLMNPKSNPMMKCYPLLIIQMTDEEISLVCTSGTIVICYIGDWKWPETISQSYNSGNPKQHNNTKIPMPRSSDNCDIKN